jgi:hypothetical protein
MHLFGRGIVPTVDNFGALGQPPSHPELLDYLAREFRADGWSVKRLIKRLVMSAAYRMDSAPLDAAAEEADPANVLLHRMPLRRVEAESVRDAILFVAGTLDETRGGPSVPAYISPYMGGFRKPSISGPMDGNRRRTIYLEVRRNFLPALLQAFDFPTPDTTHGLRNTSNVPAQSLVLMNDPFVAAQAKTWAEALCGYTAMSAEQRVATMYRRALSRAPQPEEVGAAVAFLRAQAPRYGIAEEEAPARCAGLGGPVPDAASRSRNSCLHRLRRARCPSVERFRRAPLSRRDMLRDLRDRLWRRWRSRRCSANRAYRGNGVPSSPRLPQLHRRARRT